MTDNQIILAIRVFVGAAITSSFSIVCYISTTYRGPGISLMMAWIMLTIALSPAIPVICYFLFQDQIGRFIFPPEPLDDLER